MYDTYIVQKGDTIESIANKYNITPYILIKINNFPDNYSLTPGDKILVPSINLTYFDYYTIKTGESVSKIANKYGVNTSLFALINGLEINDYIYPNQVIAVPKNNLNYYIVTKEDTLSKVADKLNTSINDIINQNSNIFLLPDQIIFSKIEK